MPHFVGSFNADLVSVFEDVFVVDVHFGFELVNQSALGLLLFVGFTPLHLLEFAHELALFGSLQVEQPLFALIQII